MKKKSNSQPLVSIIILTYMNGLDNIKKCLKSLKNISYKPLEIILVDNASTDNSVTYVKKHFPKVKLIENEKNMGFCRGNNQGVGIARGKYILFLNNDTEAASDFLSVLVDVLEKEQSVGVVQPKIRQLLSKNKLDACASYLTNTGFLYHYGYSQDQADKKYNKRLRMYSAKGACFLARKSLIDKIGLFDDDYFAYFEETDFCHRVWLAGYTVEYIPEAEVFHLGGIGKRASSFIQFHSYKNRIQTYIKNFEISTLIMILPFHVSICLTIALFYFAKGNTSDGSAIIKGIIWNVFNINKILAKRKVVQEKIRRVKDSDLLPTVKKSVKVSYYKHFLLTPRAFYDFEEI